MSNKPKTHHLGIRHHGVGSAKRVLSALDELRPDAVLIEGPADCTDLLHFLVDSAMRPPVSLLAYNHDNPDHHVYYPFTTYSPEYQAFKWAIANGVEIALIDIPTDIQLNHESPDDDIEDAQADSDNDVSDIDSATADAPEETETLEQPNDSDVEHSESDEDDELERMAQDPIGMLAECAGYQDGESWWNDYFEQQQHTDSLAVFEQVGDAMHALRESVEGKQKKRPKPRSQRSPRGIYAPANSHSY